MSFRPFWLVLLLIPTAATAQSLYSDPKAHQAGDVLTVRLAERTAAQRESIYDNESSSATSGGYSGAGGDVQTRFAVDAQFGRDSRNRNQTVQSDLLNGYITALVTARDSTGNLIIKGERRINVNGVAHVMRVAGTVRPADIRYDNSIYSFQIANAQVEYRRAGFGRKFLKPGTLTRLVGVGLLGAAVMGIMQK